MAKYCLTQKKRQNLQLTSQTDALVERILTLEVESNVMRDGYKDELAAVKAQLGKEIEQLRNENKAYQEKLAAAEARLQLASPRKQSSISDKATYGRQ